MPSYSTEQEIFEERLRLLVSHAFDDEPLLVPGELLIHGPREMVSGDRFQGMTVALLHAEPTISDAERKALLPLSPEAWAQASSVVESHFDSEPSIPERDLAVYSAKEEISEESIEPPTFDQRDEIARLTLAAGAVEIEPVEDAVEETFEELRPEPEQEIEMDLALPATLAAAAHEPDAAAPEEEVTEIILPLADVEPVVWDLAAAINPSRLTPLPLVAAALEAVGMDEDQFGFLLRYGKLAPTGRTSEIKISGLGMAEFSDRASQWFKALGASKFPIQVIDDGSGELTVYLLEAVPV